MENATGNLIWFLVPDGEAFIEDVFLPIGLTTMVFSIVATVTITWSSSSLGRRAWPAAGIPGTIGRWLLLVSWAFAVAAVLVPAFYQYRCARSIQKHFREPSSLHAVSVAALSEPIAQLCERLEAVETNRSPDQIAARLEALVTGKQMVSPPLLLRLLPNIDSATLQETRANTRQALAAKGISADHGLAWRLSTLTDIWLQQADLAAVRQSAQALLKLQGENPISVARLAESFASQRLHPALMDAAQHGRTQQWRAGDWRFLGWAFALNLAMCVFGRRRKPAD